MGVPVLSLFCGCGGLDLGFKNAGFDVHLALDSNTTAVSTYNRNHGAGIAQVADLATTEATQIIALLEAKGAGARPRGVIGGPPCQPFSTGNVSANNGNGNAAKRTLPGRYAILLKDLNTKYELDFFVFENVRGITFSKHENDFTRFKGLFEDAGFRLAEGLLDAQYFGVPQKRPRIFVVGWNRDKYAGWNYHFPDARRDAVKSVSDAIGDLQAPVFYKHGLDPETFPVHPNHWTMQPKSKRFGNGTLKEGQHKGRSFRVLSWSKPSWTVAYGNREIHIHPSCTRRLSIYEAMLLQGFPPSYKLNGTLSEQVHQVSDAVPPPLAEILASSILGFLNGDPRFRVLATEQLALLEGQ